MAITITDFENIGAIALPAVSAAGNVRIVFDVADNLLKMSQNGAAYVPFGTSVTGGGWTDDGTNVRLTTSTDTVSVGTTTPPAAGTRMSVQADVAPSGGPPSVVNALSLDGNVTGVTTAFTGVGVALRVENTVGAMTTIAGFGALYTDVTLGVESAGAGVFAMYQGAAPALVATLGPDGIGAHAVGSSQPQIALSVDIGSTFPRITLSDGTNPSDWELQRVAAGVAGLGATSRFQFGGNTTPTTDNTQTYASGGAFRIQGLNATGSGIGASMDFIWTTGNRTINAAGAGDATGTISIGTGATDSTDAGGTGGDTGDVQIGTGSATSTLGTSGNSGAVTVSTGNSADGNSGDVTLGTGTAGGTRGIVSVNAAAFQVTGAWRMVATEIAFGASPYTPLATDCFILADPTGGNIVINLPSVASSRNRIFVISHSSNSANTVSVTPNGGDTIDLVAAATVLTAQQSMSIIAQPTGANWKIW